MSNFYAEIPSKIIQNLYLGSIYSTNPIILNQLGINNVVSAIKTNKSNTWNTFNLRWDDIPSQNIFPEIDNAYHFINSKLNLGEKVLVHCHAGVSRSTTVILYYLMKKFQLPLKTAYSIVKNQRNIINPNPGFMQQLQFYETFYS